MDRWRGWAAEHGLPLYSTEGWASIVYDAPAEPRAAWAWVKDCCAEAVATAVDKGWDGICTTNSADRSSPPCGTTWPGIRS
jgi:hypothetical protein